MAGFAAGALRGKIGCNRPPAAASHPPELTDRLKGYNSHKRVCCRFCVAAVIVLKLRHDLCPSPVCAADSTVMGILSPLPSCEICEICDVSELFRVLH